MEGKNTVLFVFRKDLRINCNFALSNAAKIGKVILLYVLDDKLFLNDRQKLWACCSVKKLSENLVSKYNVKMICKVGNACNEIVKIVKNHNISEVFFNTLWDMQEYDNNLKKNLENADIKYNFYNSSLLLIENNSIKNTTNNFYKTFFSYRKKALEYTNHLAEIEEENYSVDTFISISNEEEGNASNILSAELERLSNNFSIDESVIGESSAKNLFEEFTKNNLNSYKDKRGDLDKVYTSMLSTNLHFGEISILSIWYDIQSIITKNTYVNTGDNIESVSAFADQLLWREFGYYVLNYFPEFPNKDMNEGYEYFPWQYNEEYLELWKKGQTGYDIVDAAMYQLNEKGWISNRARMIVASFLTKHLLMDWRHGAKYFLDNLLDADLANNSLGWQWVAGSYPASNTNFRIFNPDLQQERFDPNKTYVDKWLKNRDPIVRIVNHKEVVAKAKDVIYHFLTKK